MRKHNYKGTAAAVLTAVILLMASGVGAAAAGQNEESAKPYSACVNKDAAQTYVEQAVINNRVTTIQKGETVCLWTSDNVGEIDPKRWISSNSAVAEVDWIGSVTGVSEGKATISLTENDGTVIDSVEITVIDTAETSQITAVTSLTEAEEELPVMYENAAIVLEHTQIVEGQTVKLMLTGAENADSISWESMSPRLAEVDENGNVTALCKGDATICCYDESGCRIAEITLFIYMDEEVVDAAVITDKITSLELNGEGWLHWDGEGEYDTVVWSSSDNDVLTVSWRGIVHACGKGEATLYLKNIRGETLDSVTITVG